MRDARCAIGRITLLRFSPGKNDLGSCWSNREVIILSPRKISRRIANRPVLRFEEKRHAGEGDGRLGSECAKRYQAQSSEHQSPGSSESPKIKLQEFDLFKLSSWSWEIDVSLELGSWDLALRPMVLPDTAHRTTPSIRTRENSSPKCHPITTKRRFCTSQHHPYLRLI